MQEYKYPNEGGWFEKFGGRYVAEILMAPLQELESAYREAKKDPAFWEMYRYFCRHYVGRPTPTYFAERLTQKLGGGKIFLKREDLCHTGAHKVNNVLGQVLLAKRMGKKRIIAETGAGQHGVASAVLAARFGMECVIFMGEEDLQRQASNVYRMKLLGATVVSVASGTRTLKDAMNEAMREWVTRIDDTFYVIGTAAGPHPYPQMVRDFQSIIGQEAKAQVLELTGRLPNTLVACVGGGSNAIGFFYHFLEEKDVEMVGVEAAGLGIATGHHAATISSGSALGVLHGAKTYLMQDADGQVLPTHSISAGLDYPGIGPEHCLLHDLKRVKYASCTDQEALEAFHLLSTQEGIIPALESSHALAWVIRQIPTMDKEQIVFVNLSGRGDKDIHTVAQFTGMRWT